MLLVLAYVLIFHLCIIWDQDVQLSFKDLCYEMKCMWPNAVLAVFSGIVIVTIHCWLHNYPHTHALLSQWHKQGSRLYFFLSYLEMRLRIVTQCSMRVT